MIQLRKFYDADPEGGAEAPSETVGIAGLMSRYGYLSENRPTVREDVVDNRNEEPTKAEPTNDAAKANNGGNVVEGTDNPNTPKAEVATQVQAEPQKVVEQAPQLSLQEVLKQQQPDIILKELGYGENQIGFLKEFKDLDPKMVAFLDTWKSGGDLTNYLKELTTDYSKMPAEEVMRHQLRQEYPKASEKQLDILFKKEVIDAYGLDPDNNTEDEIEIGRELLNAKADRFRDTLVEKQNNFLLPKAPERTTEVVDDGAAQFEAYKQAVVNDQYTQALVTTQQLTLGEGEDKFNFALNPKEVQDVLFNSDKWAESLFEVGQDGKMKPKTQHQLLVATVAKYGQGFIDALAKHYISVGSKKAIDPIDNPSPVEVVKTSNATPTPKSAAEAMAKYGRTT